MSSITLRLTRLRLFSSFTTSLFACRSTTASRLLASDMPTSTAITNNRVHNSAHLVAFVQATITTQQPAFLRRAHLSGGYPLRGTAAHRQDPASAVQCGHTYCGGLQRTRPQCLCTLDAPPSTGRRGRCGNRQRMMHCPGGCSSCPSRVGDACAADAAAHFAPCRAGDGLPPPGGAQHTHQDRTRKDWDCDAHHV
jgi:hypothetical protein